MYFFIRRMFKRGLKLGSSSGLVSYMLGYIYIYLYLSFSGFRFSIVDDLFTKSQNILVLHDILNLLVNQLHVYKD